jgi:hypothetical protein
MRPVRYAQRKTPETLPKLPIAFQTTGTMRLGFRHSQPLGLYPAEARVFTYSLPLPEIGDGEAFTTKQQMAVKTDPC